MTHTTTTTFGPCTGTKPSTLRSEVLFKHRVDDRTYLVKRTREGKLTLSWVYAGTKKGRT